MPAPPRSFRSTPSGGWARPCRPSAEAGSALDDLQMEIQRGLQWIHHDCKEYWAAEVRRGGSR